MPKKITFQITRDQLGTYNGDTIGFLVLDADGLEALSGGMQYVSDVVAYAVTGDPRGTIDVIIDTIDGDTTRTYLIRDPESTVPTVDTTGTEPRAVVFYDPTGGTDATDKLIAGLEVIDPDTGYDGWEVDPADGIAEIIDASDALDRLDALDGRTDLLEAQTVAGLPFTAGDIDAETLAGELEPFLPTGGGGGGNAEVLEFLHDIDLTGDFDTMPTFLYGPLPRFYFNGKQVLVAEGPNFGVFTMTASGACPPGPALELHQQIQSATGFVATTVSVDGETVSGVSVKAERVAVDLIDTRARLAASFATPTPTLGAYRFALCGDGEAFLSDATEITRNAWSTDGWNWVDSSFIRVNGARILGTGLPLSPSDGDAVFPEFASKPHDALGDPGFSGWDTQEFAPWIVWVAAEQRWKMALFYEKTSTGATDEDANPDSFPVELAFGVDFDLAVYDQFDTGAGRRIRLLVGAPDYLADVFLDGRGWITVEDRRGPALDIEDSILPQWIGLDLGYAYAHEILFKEEPSGTLIASPNADVAHAAGEGNPFDDGQSNTWTPFDTGWVVPEPTGGPLGIVDHIDFTDTDDATTQRVTVDAGALTTTEI